MAFTNTRMESIASSRTNYDGTSHKHDASSLKQSRINMFYPYDVVIKPEDVNEFSYFDDGTTELIAEYEVYEGDESVGLKESYEYRVIKFDRNLWKVEITDDISYEDSIYIENIIKQDFRNHVKSEREECKI